MIPIASPRTRGDLIVTSMSCHICMTKVQFGPWTGQIRLMNRDRNHAPIRGLHVCNTGAIIRNNQCIIQSARRDQIYTITSPEIVTRGLENGIQPYKAFAWSFSKHFITPRAY